ncbi:bifunctional diguanylate cyclase/phosphodiesterase [Clostridium kluyveri]|uniref:GGDEF-domain containing protein n=1 Tax=Clostridium kluyveri TaxID=1534 RepID=A0A1L5F680_CLOKL|nr:GGDEF domain-containing phosphodiesterase [Clostridium kluyveri]APM38487.1 GGDEF-domain containing protein [Clostridium kluyveri]
MEIYNGSNEQIYKRALTGANISLWEWNLEKCCIFFSDNFKNILGYDTDDFKNLFDFIEEIVIPQDKLSAKNDLTFFIKGNTETYRSEFKISTKEKHIRALLVKGAATRNSAGEIILLSGSINDVTQKKRLEEYINYSAYYDSLTGLPNRILFRNDLKTILDNYKNGALIFINIDDFKSVNDTFGHDYGDLLLIIFSQLIAMCIEPYGTLYRLGGDEFMLLIDKLNSYNELEKLCMEISHYLRNPFEVKEKQIYITISIGIALFPEDSRDVAELYKYADLAVFESKQKGKNTTTFFKKELFYFYRRKLIIEQELKTAIENNELYILYQPQIDAVENKVIGFESLLRWKNRKLGFISPQEFIPICESTGIIIDIGEWVLNSVCKMIYELQLKGFKVETISVNVSPIQLRNSDFVTRLINICEKNEISPSLLEIEITEGTLIDLYTCKIKTLDELLKKGVRVAIDDFGTGYSSLNYLTILPVNTLKIDKSFIDNIESKKNKAVIKSIINLCKSLNYNIIAEGVETKKQLDCLLHIGCNTIQGYYFSKPLPVNKIEDILKKSKFGGFQFE